MKLFLPLLLLAAVLVYWRWVLTVVAVVVVVWLLVRACRGARARLVVRREVWAGLSARAVQQDRWYVEGDPRGVYGEWVA